MAIYKVAQDVEADDKLIGPFSFRQFIYLLIVAGAITLAWTLGTRVFLPLAIIPLPIIVFFGALALPLKKDQPMEIYLAAVMSYYMKPRKRLWTPDGVESLVEITAPQEIEVQRTKDLSQEEAERRLSYLATIADTEGWAIRNPTAVMPQQSPMQGDFYYEAQQTQDMLDTNSQIGQSFDTMIQQTNTRLRQEAVDRMYNPQAAPAPQPLRTSPPPVHIPGPADPYANLSGMQSDSNQPVYNPYPTNIRQSVVQPLNSTYHASQHTDIPDTSAPDTTATPSAEPESTSEKPLSPDIINLANNKDLSIETIAREAHRIEEKQELAEEVVISLR